MVAASVTGAARTLAMSGTIGFDAIQMLAPRGLFQAAKDSLRLGTRNAERVSVGGWSYATDGAGKAIEGSRRMSLGFFAPSEFTTGLAASMMARRAAGRGIERRAISTDDYYQAALNLASGRNTVSGVLVNAVGEGYEEAAQAVLEPISHTADVDWNAVGESFLTGAAFGAGMSVAATRQYASQDRIIRNLSDSIRLSTGQKPFTDEQWARKSDLERRASVLSDPEAAKAIAHLASIGVTHIALFQTDDAFGSDGAEGARKGLASAGLKAVFEEKVPRDKPDFSAVAARAAKEGVQAVMVIASV